MILFFKVFNCWIYVVKVIFGMTSDISRHHLIKWRLWENPRKMWFKISVKVATSSVIYGGIPLNILPILLKMKINHYHFLKLHIFKYFNLVYRLFILTGHILVETVPSSLSKSLWVWTKMLLFWWGCNLKVLVLIPSLHNGNSSVS